jgi:hypothetical protein
MGLYGLYRAAMEIDSWWALLNVAVLVFSGGCVQGHLVDTGECGGMSCIELLWGGTFCGQW